MKKLVLVLIVLAFISNTNAQKGLFGKFSLGVGIQTETSKIKETSLSVASKNHQIGWGISDKVAIYVGEFGGLSLQGVGNYKTINLDAVGVGVTYRFPKNYKISALGAYAVAHYAKDAKEALGDFKGRGMGLNLVLEKEWIVGKHWGISVGPQFFWIKTFDTGLDFFNASINVAVLFYLSPIKSFKKKERKNKKKSKIKKEF